MNKNDLKIQIKKILCNQFFLSKNPYSIPNDISILDLGIDSIDFFHFIFSVGKKYNFEIAEEEIKMENFETVNNIVNYINNKVN